MQRLIVLHCLAFLGTRSRFRIHSCGLPADSQQEACGRAPFFGTWSLWGSCSRTCGGGQQTRSRVGFCGNQDETEVNENELLKIRLFAFMMYLNICVSSRSQFSGRVPPLNGKVLCSIRSLWVTRRSTPWARPFTSDPWQKKPYSRFGLPPNAVK